MKRKTRLALKIGLPIGILAAGALGMYLLIQAKEEPEKEEKRVGGVLVETTQVYERAHRLDVYAQGVVEAAREVEVRPRVSGKVVWVNDAFVPGGQIEAGETILRIEPQDYRLQVRRSETAVAQAEAELQRAEGRTRVARREWELFRDELRMPQRDFLPPSEQRNERQKANANRVVESAQASGSAEQSSTGALQTSNDANLQTDSAVGSPRAGRLATQQASRAASPSARAPSNAPALALRKPQLESAEAALQSAQVQLDQAELNLERTAVGAPFKGFVRQESVEVGDVINAQRSVGTLVGTDAFWARLSIPVTRIDDIAIPGLTADQGSRAVVRQELGGRIVQRKGRVVRLLGDLGAAGRMAQVLVRIPNPYVLNGERTNDHNSGDQIDEPPMPQTNGFIPPSEAFAPQPDSRQNRGRFPLLINAYVDVVVYGRHQEVLVETPREALREGDKVYVYTDDDRLEIRTVEVVWRRPQTVLVGDGLDHGDRVVLSRLASPVEGMKLRRRETTEVRAKRGDRTASHNEDEDRSSVEPPREASPNPSTNLEATGRSDNE